MPVLSHPAPEFRASFLEGMAELMAEGRGRLEDTSSIGEELRFFSPRWQQPSVFAEYVAALRAEADERAPRPAGRVPSTTWWWTDGGTWLGRIALRHRLTPSLLEVGGHIGYDVRPSARRHGHATAMLAAVLPHAAALGIERALLTCDVDNIGSRRVIEANGGQLDDQRGGKLRYWIVLDGPR